MTDRQPFFCLKITGGIIKILYIKWLLLNVAGEMWLFLVYLKCLTEGGGGGEANIWNLENPKPFGKL